MSAPTENFASANFNCYRNSCELIEAHCSAQSHNVDCMTKAPTAVASCPSLDAKDSSADDGLSASNGSNSSQCLYGEKQQHKFCKRIYKREKKRQQRKSFDGNSSLAHTQYQQQCQAMEQQAFAHQLISTCTQTAAADCCEQCGCEKSLICLTCKSTDAQDLDAQSVDTLSSNEFISTPRSKGDLLLQAIQRTPKVAARHAAKCQNKLKRTAALNERSSSPYASPVTASSTSLLGHLDSGYRMWKCHETQHHFTAYNIESNVNSCSAAAKRESISNECRNSNTYLLSTPAASQVPLMHLDSGYRAWKCQETQQTLATYSIEENSAENNHTAAPMEISSATYAQSNAEFSAPVAPSLDSGYRACTCQLAQRNLPALQLENEVENSDVKSKLDNAEQICEDKVDNDAVCAQNDESNGDKESNVSIELSCGKPSISPLESLSDLKVTAEPSSLALDKGKATAGNDVTEEEYFVSSSKLTPHFVRLALSSEPAACTSATQPHKNPTREKKTPAVPSKRYGDGQCKSDSTSRSSTPTGSLTISMDCELKLPPQQQEVQPQPSTQTQTPDCNIGQTIQLSPSMSLSTSVSTKIPDPVFPFGIVAINRFKFEQAAMAANSSQPHQHHHQHKLSNTAKITDINTTPVRSPNFTTIFKRRSRNFFQRPNYSTLCTDEPQSSDGGCCSDCGPTVTLLTDPLVPKCSVSTTIVDTNRA